MRRRASVQLSPRPHLSPFARALFELHISRDCLTLADSSAQSSGIISRPAPEFAGSRSFARVKRRKFRRMFWTAITTLHISCNSSALYRDALCSASFASGHPVRSHYMPNFGLLLSEAPNFLSLSASASSSLESSSCFGGRALSDLCRAILDLRARCGGRFALQSRRIAPPKLSEEA